jgi:Tfp pilus assembly protein PilF
MFLLIFILVRWAWSDSDGTGDHPGPPGNAPSPGLLLIAAAVGALLFSLHPLRVESVAWVADRKDLLCAVFLFPAYISYFLYATNRPAPGARRWFLLTVFLHACALLAKPSAMTAPVIFLAVDFFILERGPRKTHFTELLLEKWPFFLLSIGCGLVALLTAPTNEQPVRIGLVEKLLYPWHGLMLNISKLLWPSSLAPIYEFPTITTAVGASILLLIITVVCAVLWKARQPWWLGAWVIFIVTSIPTTFFFYAGIQPVADRYTYLSMVGIDVLIGAGVARAYREAGASGDRWVLLSAASLATILLVASMFVLSRRQMEIWQSSETLWHHTIDVSPSSPVAYSNLGNAVADDNRYDEAQMLYNIALKLDPDDKDALNNLGVAQFAVGKSQDALETLQRAIRLDPGNARPWINQAQVFMSLGRMEDAVASFKRAVEIDPQSPLAAYGLGSALDRRGDQGDALGWYERALSIDGEMGMAWYQAGLIHEERGEDSLAVYCLQQAVRFGESDAAKALDSMNAGRRGGK